MLLLGDCNDWLKEIKDNSIDLIVSDPPYGIEFMSRDWDRAVVPTATWKECYRVLKEGKLAFVMCSPRQDVLSRMIINLQDAGFRTNYTSIYWTYASGFPKAANVSKLLDKKNGRYFDTSVKDYLNQKRKEKGLSFSDINKYLGDAYTGGGTASSLMGDHNSNSLPTLENYNKLKTLLELDNRFDELIQTEEAEREIIATKQKARSEGDNYAMPTMGAKTKYIDINITKPATEAAKKMEGAYVGFQPKPAVEVILVVSKGKTLTWLDDVKIPTSSAPDNVFVSLAQVCDSILDSSLSTTWYNKNCINHDRHVDAHDDILGNELNRWLVYAQTEMTHSPNASLDENVLYEVLSLRSYCPSCLRFYDVLTRWITVYAQDIVPPLTDVLGYIREFALAHKHIPPHQYNAHLSNVDGLLRILGVLVSGDSLAYYSNPRQTDTKRFPANLLVSDDVLNNGTITKSQQGLKKRKGGQNIGKNTYDNIARTNPWKCTEDNYGGYNDSGSYSRYFSLDAWKTFPFIITPKASRAERNKGLDSLEPVKVNDGRNTPIDNPFQRGETLRNNSHPTVKPLKLMSYLITMGSREGDLVLDPFCGSGTVCIAADQLHRKWIGIEKNEEYAAIIKKRLMVPLSQLKLTVFE